MRNLVSSFATIALLAGVLAVNGGACGDNASATGGAGAGGASGGGVAGEGGGAGTTSACALGAGTGVGGMGGSSDAPAPTGTPQEINDALLNAPTAGGIEVIRAAPTSTYPTCQ